MLVTKSVFKLVLSNYQTCTFLLSSTRKFVIGTSPLVFSSHLIILLSVVQQETDIIQEGLLVVVVLIAAFVLHHVKIYGRGDGSLVVWILHKRSKIEVKFVLQCKDLPREVMVSS